MRRYIERLRRAVWSYKQHLTLVPTASGAPVSDLFVWRSCAEWETFFELTDIPDLFDDEPTGNHVKLVFFDASGRRFLETVVQSAPRRRCTLSISEIVGKEHGESGTFCVFHSHTPKSISVLGSHLSERGYLSYRFRGAPLRAYVHGNLDAAALLPEQNIQLLGGCSLLYREYNLQHLLVRGHSYEFGVVNPTAKTQRIICRTINSDGKLYSSQVADLAPRGSHLFGLVPEHTQQRIVMSSRLVMARPLVFRMHNQTMDVFHG
jgi:hypothetical protein